MTFVKEVNCLQMLAFITKWLVMHMPPEWATSYGAIPGLVAQNIATNCLVLALTGVWGAVKAQSRHRPSNPERESQPSLHSEASTQRT